MLRKLNLLPVDALQGLNVLRQLAEIGVKPEQIPDFVQAVKKVSEDAGYEPQKVTQASIKICEIETQSGKTYPEATEDFEILARAQTLKQANMTEREISRVNQLNSGLRAYGVDLYDTENLLKYLMNMKENAYNPRRFVSLSKKHGSLKRSLTRINAEISEKTQTRDALEREIKTAKTKTLELQSLVEHYQEDADRANAIKSQLETEANIKTNELRDLEARIAEKEIMRQALIIQNAKLSGIPESKIGLYQFQKRFDLLEEISKIRIRRLLEKGLL